MSKLLHRSLEAKLAALDGPEWDSSDDEKSTEQEDVQNKHKAKKKKKKSQKNNQNSDANEDNTEVNDSSSSVIYLGHMPPTFEETQILTFFSQFGKVKNIKLSRSRRTGNPRGYAFVEFDDVEVASIVADTMSGYFLKGERRLVCHVLPKDKVHPKLFQGAKRNLQLSQSDMTVASRIHYWRDKEREKVNKHRSLMGIKKITKRLLSREKKKREQLKNIGIDYDFPGYTASYNTVRNAITTASTVEKENKKRKASEDDFETEEDELPITNTKKLKKSKKKDSKASIDNEAKKDEMLPVKSEKKKKKQKKTETNKTIAALSSKKTLKTNTIKKQSSKASISTPIIKRKESIDKTDKIQQMNSNNTSKPKKNPELKQPATEIKKKENLQRKKGNR